MRKRRFVLVDGLLLDLNLILSTGEEAPDRMKRRKTQSPTSGEPRARARGAAATEHCRQASADFDQARALARPPTGSRDDDFELEINPGASDDEEEDEWTTRVVRRHAQGKATHADRNTIVRAPKARAVTRPKAALKKKRAAAPKAADTPASVVAAAFERLCASITPLVDALIAPSSGMQSSGSAAGVDILRSMSDDVDCLCEMMGVDKSRNLAEKLPLIEAGVRELSPSFVPDPTTKVSARIAALRAAVSGA